MLCHDPLLIFPLGSQWVTCVSSYLLLFIACFLISSLVAFAFLLYFTFFPYYTLLYSTSTIHLIDFSQPPILVP